MLGSSGTIPAECPDCGGEVRTACPACEAPIVSLMGIACRECGAPLREPHLFGVEIRRKPERAPAAVAVDDPASARDNEKQSQ
jgi:predicted amidophosphoribosyltransferase